jgi:hypothetical protein
LAPLSWAFSPSMAAFESAQPSGAVVPGCALGYMCA